MLYTLHLYTDECQLFLNKTRVGGEPAELYVKNDKNIMLLSVNGR